MDEESEIAKAIRPFAPKQEVTSTILAQINFALEAGDAITTYLFWKITKTSLSKFSSHFSKAPFDRRFFYVGRIVNKMRSRLLGERGAHNAVTLVGVSSILTSAI